MSSCCVTGVRIKGVQRVSFLKAGFERDESNQRSSGGDLKNGRFNKELNIECMKSLIQFKNEVGEGKGGGSRCNRQRGWNLNWIQELRGGLCGWGIADFLVGLLMLLNGKIRKNEKAEKDPEGIWVGVGRKDSIISLHDRINDSKFSTMVDYRCAYSTGEYME